MRLARLALTGERHVQEVLLGAQVFEGGDHVGLEVVPAQAVLLAGHGGGWSCCSDPATSDGHVIVTTLIREIRAEKI